MPSIINATTTNGLSTSADNSGSLQLATNNGTTAVTIDTNQNVGIGTTTLQNDAGYKTLSISGSSGGQIAFQTAGVTKQGIYGDATDFNIINTAAGYIRFLTNNSERMRITSDGTSQFRSTTGIAPWDATSGTYAWVGQSTYPLGLTSQGNIVAIMNRNTSTGAVLEFKYNNGYVGAVTTNGTTTSYTSASDYRLKNEVTPMTGALETVAQLNPVQFKFKSNGSNGQGFIAHELQAVVPDAVTGEKDAVDAEGKPVYQGVDTSFLVATLTAAIQELNAKVEAQAVRIAELEGAK